MATVPVVALIGRPNVGKSTLFNRLTRSRDALVDNQPGVTRDRLYGRSQIGGQSFLVVDTGGLASDPGFFQDQILQQVEQVIEEAQALIFLVDYQEGLVPSDRDIAERLRQAGRPVWVAVNKSEGEVPDLAVAEFQELGLGAPRAISALRGHGVEELVRLALAGFVDDEPDEAQAAARMALVGRPNVGKSTLTNRIVGSDRMIVSEVPGTTRDSVRIPFDYAGREFTVVDTAGVRRRARVEEVLEKFSVIKTLQSIEEADVVVLVLDARREIGTQDATVAGMVLDLGRSVVVVVNKWDGLETHQRRRIRDHLERKLAFLPDPEMVFVSALHGSNLSQVMPAVVRALDSSRLELGTARLNQTLESAIIQTPPPMYQNRPIKLKFAHQAGKNPPVVVVHGTQAERLPGSYLRYLGRYFARRYRLRGTRIRVIPRNGVNPFAHRKKRSKGFRTVSGGRRKL